MSTPKISVGIQFEKEITFSFSGIYFSFQNQNELNGTWKAKIWDTGIELSKDGESKYFENGLVLTPENESTCSFKLKDVTIGIEFHWERKEDQVFNGALKLLQKNGKIWAINILSLEDYLISVISSEMSATSSSELLKAHAVISRSWLLAQIDKNKSLQSKEADYQSIFQTEDERIRWYDREDHADFDVCADDHCQRYQGISRASTSFVENAVSETHGQVLSYEGEICDARFSKCCGGVTEVFENVWEPVNHPYLQKFTDVDKKQGILPPTLEEEKTARNWILDSPTVFCNTKDKKVLQQVLNDYDQETNDFFRWKVSYTQEEISTLIKRKMSIDFGRVTDLIPVERGTSSRIIRLKIIGSKKTMTIGKELEIRKALSSSHLYSSAFVVEKTGIEPKITFILHGAGWGHGVGLCQIGAAVMGDKGYSYEKILQHYYRRALLKKRY
ncbi:MAG: SpoIID/LytB domain-containing protein [Bacteroidetes bacterium]|nr:SpoIID/LytB domain-containing protein [Bacteroidota bacterium]